MKWIRFAVALFLLGTLTFDYDAGFKLKAAYAQAAGALTISWTPPTQYTDNAPLLEQDLDYYTFSCNGTELKQIDSVIGTRSDVINLTALPTGSYTCHLTVTTNAGSESGPSNTVNFTIGPRVPMAPGLALS